MRWCVLRSVHARVSVGCELEVLELLSFACAYRLMDDWMALDTLLYNR
jgi:hypothetical protein